MTRSIGCKMKHEFKIRYFDHCKGQLYSREKCVKKSYTVFSREWWAGSFCWLTLGLFVVAVLSAIIIMLCKVSFWFYFIPAAFGICVPIAFVISTFMCPNYDALEAKYCAEELKACAALTAQARTDCEAWQKEQDELLMARVERIINQNDPEALFEILKGFKRELNANH